MAEGVQNPHTPGTERDREKTSVVSIEKKVFAELTFARN